MELVHLEALQFLQALSQQIISFFDNPVNETKSWNYNNHNMADILMIILNADLSKTKYLNDKERL